MKRFIKWSILWTIISMYHLTLYMRSRWLTKKKTFVQRQLFYLLMDAGLISEINCKRLAKLLTFVDRGDLSYRLLRFEGESIILLQMCHSSTPSDDLHLPKVSTNWGKEMFKYAGSALKYWNSLEVDVKQSTLIDNFKTTVKKNTDDQSYHSLSKIIMYMWSFSLILQSLKKWF